MALTAGTPILKGRLTDHDVRWEVISAVCDDRTPIERGESSEPLAWEKLPDAEQSASAKRRSLAKSRYASISSFVSNHAFMKDKYNDIPLPMDEMARKKLAEAGALRSFIQRVL